MTAPAEAPLCLRPSPLPTTFRDVLPEGTVDCHLHVFRDGAPLASPRNYTPHMLTLADWQDFASMAGVARGVLVQPSVYGFDNSVMLEAIATAPDALRGIAVVDPQASERELERLHLQGVRGVRCNTRNLGGLGFDVAIALSSRIAPLGWTLQFQILPEQLDALAGIAPGLGLPLVLDHVGFIDPRDQATIGRLRRLLDTGTCYLKLSAPYRIGQTYRTRAMADLISELVGSHHERLIWGSDWPHTELWSDMPDDAALIEDISSLLTEPQVRQAIFVETPRTLFFKS